MLTPEGPKVLEYNVRFGDPETQTVLRRLDSDILDIFEAAVNGTLDNVQPVWSSDSVTTVIIASGGYPGTFETGKVITGIDAADEVEGVRVFHSGTRLGPDGKVVSAGGRVLAVTARAESLDQSRLRAYEAVEKISFEGAFYRKDIGVKGLG
jgi:phosphoribosylamine--glycine ligase